MRVASPEAIARLLLARLDERGERRRPVTLQELVGDLLPYERVRAALGLAGKAEYDLALLALLRAREYLVIDPLLLDAVERELRAPEPELASLDELSDALVQLRDHGHPIERAGPGEARPEPRDEPPAGEEEAPFDPTDAFDPADALDPGDTMDPGDTFDPTDTLDPPDAFDPAGAPAAARPPDEPAAPPVAEPPAAAPAPEAPVVPRAAGHPAPDPDREPEAPVPSRDCVRCGRPRPERPGLRFCPFCGADQTERRCAACGEPLEPEWAYCPACGLGVEEAPRGRA